MAEATTVNWTFLTNHAQVLLCIADDPGVRLREIGERVGITERATHRIVVELEAPVTFGAAVRAGATATRSGHSADFRIRSPAATASATYSDCSPERGPAPGATERRAVHLRIRSGRSRGFQSSSSRRSANGPAFSPR